MLAQTNTEQEYQLKNLLLGFASDWFVEKETLQKAKETLPILSDFYNERAECLDNLPLNSIIKEPLPDVHTVPLFSKELCNLLVNEMHNMTEHFGFEPNEEEDELRQIPEIVLYDKCPQLYHSLMQVVDSVINPILLSIWNRHVTGGNIQIANYNLKDKKQGAWHHDASSDISIVVPLNTGDYEGGGTEFMRKGTVEPLPTGNALIFPSLTHMHRGLPVISGDRYLLVFWLVCKDESKEYMKEFMQEVGQNHEK
tara:strand:- start:16 stop:777 length:762 start_codon:yes stop_codon:yes gene_type:complete